MCQMCVGSYHTLNCFLRLDLAVFFLDYCLPVALLIQWQLLAIPQKDSSSKYLSEGKN